MNRLLGALSALLCCSLSSSHTLDPAGKNVCHSVRYISTLPSLAPVFFFLRFHSDDSRSQSVTDARDIKILTSVEKILWNCRYFLRSLCWTAPWSEYWLDFIFSFPLNYFLRPFPVFVVDLSWLDTTVSNLIIFDMSRDPSTLVCCTGWRQEGKECTIREFILMDRIMPLLPPCFLCFPGFSFTYAFCVCVFSCVWGWAGLP